MAHPIDRERRRVRGVHLLRAGGRRRQIDRGRGGFRHGCIAMPQGSSPTWMVLMTFWAATSITETSLERPLVESRYFPSGVNAMCQARWPTRRYFVTAWLAPSTTAMRLAGPSATKT